MCNFFWLLSKLYLQMAMLFIDVSAIKHQTCIAKKAVSKPMVLVIQRNRGVLETPGLRGRASIKEARTGFQEPGRPQFHTNPKRIFPGNVEEENTTYFEKMEVN